MFIASNSDCRSFPSWKPELSINKLYTCSDDEEDEEDEFKMVKENVAGDKIIEPEPEQDIFEIYDADSIANGIFNLEQIRDSYGNKLHIRSYSNNLLLIKQWDFTNNENNKEVFNSLKYYQWATSVIEKHFNNENNILCFLKQEFVKIFTKRYIDKLENLKGKQVLKQDFENILSDCVVELLQFIRVLQESLSLYYDLDFIRAKFSKLCLFTKDNLKNFTTSLLLNDDFYYLIFALHKRMYKSHAKKLRKNFQLISQYTPDKFGISPALCLNQDTIEYFKKQNLLESCMHISRSNLFKEGRSQSDKAEDNSFHSLHKNSNDNLLHLNDDPRSKSEISMGESKGLSPKRHITFQKNHPENRFQREDSYLDMNQLKPYDSAIKTFKNIVFYRSPTHKLKIILKTLEKIEKCIHKFYDKFNINFGKALAGDEVLTIFLYVVSKCNIPNIYAHLKFIDNFSTSNVLNSKAGYFNATLQICASHLEDIDGGNPEASEEEKQSFFSQSVRSCIEEINRKGFKI